VFVIVSERSFAAVECPLHQLLAVCSYELVSVSLGFASRSDAAPQDLLDF